MGDVYVTDKLDYRLEFSKHLNPKYCGNPNKVNVVKEIKNQGGEAMPPVTLQKP